MRKCITTYKFGNILYNKSLKKKTARSYLCKKVKGMTNSWTIDTKWFMLFYINCNFKTSLWMLAFTHLKLQIYTKFNKSDRDKLLSNDKSTPNYNTYLSKNLYFILYILTTLDSIINMNANIYNYII